ncbi:MAG: L,D-transpeptidase family protein, partial [Flavitalea sp.]
SDRNYSINKQNAYSDLFMDSTAVEKFIAQQKLNDTIADDLRLFYNLRNFQFAWFSTDGATEQMLSFRSLYDYSKDSGATRKSLDNRLDDILTNDSLGTLTASPTISKTELLLTWRFINYVHQRNKRESDQRKLYAEMVPAMKSPVLTVADAMLEGTRNDFKVPAQDYESLKKQLALYTEKAKAGGFPKISATGKILKKGTKNKSIKQIKQRLAAESLYSSDTTEVFTDELESVVRETQARYGLTADGRIGASLIKQLNIPAEQRVEQILINLERMKWMPAEPKGRLIIVNIPEFKLHVRDGSSKAFDMDIVVGKEGNNTINFSGNLNQVVFNPYWNVPRSIVSKEVVPGMDNNEYYLEDHNMEVTGEEDGLPVVRQLPGDRNALGRVKFLFPNSFNIYFHDTPEKELFKRTKRAYSHGCIRLADPMKMANYLLEDDEQWSAEKVDSVLSTEKEKYVRVKDPVPVLISYYTCWVNENGKIEFRDDIYSHDKKISRKLFSQPAGSGGKLAAR